VLVCAKGRDVVAPSLVTGLVGETRQRAEPEAPVLSPREREVLRLIAAGSSIPAIAKELYLAPSTVKTHVQRLYEKLGAGDRAAAVAEACTALSLSSVARPVQQFVDYFAAESIRVSAICGCQ
jgi:two-component system, NarL family, nitrate/nitrite response regulator NarL